MSSGLVSRILYTDASGFFFLYEQWSCSESFYIPILYDTQRLKIETKPVHLPNEYDSEYLFVQPVSEVCILPTDET